RARHRSGTGSPIRHAPSSARTRRHVHANAAVDPSARPCHETIAYLFARIQHGSRIIGRVCWWTGTGNLEGTGGMPQAVRFDKYGDIDVLEVRDVPRPRPAADEVLVRVRAAGINPGE